MAKAAAQVGPDYKTDPAALKRGMPPEQSNGLYGSEDRLIALGVKGRFFAVVTLDVADIKTSEAEHSTFPLVELVHIEPIWSAEGLEAIKAQQETAYKERTGANQLDFDGITPEVEEAMTDAPVTDIGSKVTKE